MAFQFSQKSLDRMKGVDPRLIQIAHAALAISPIDFGIPEDGGVRTAARQLELCEAGKSKCDGFVKRSKHQDGKALDVYAFVDGKASWQEHHLTTVAAALLQAAAHFGTQVEWGGFWHGFRDMPHIQLAD